ncbi:MAG TPA: porin family protein [Ferruginibacter sp.]|nr:porin family protein [Ferruginibacter sp.]HMP22108.1 porin family protein [Ferruginibacter sp.]
MKIFFSAALLLLLLQSTRAQSNVDAERENFFRFGAKAGFNINKISGRSYKDAFNYNYQIGAFLQFNFSKRFGIQPEVNLVQSSSELTDDVTDIYDDIFRGGSQKKASLNYLEIPVLLNINVGESKRVKLQLGPAYGNMLKQTVDSVQGGGNLFKNNDWSAIGGLWIQLPFVHIGARYKLGLSNINSEIIDDGRKWCNQAIQAFVGVTF